MRLMGLLPALACLAVSLAVVPVNLLVLRTQTRLRRQTLVHTDARVKLTGEVLSGGAAGWTAPCSSCFGSLRGASWYPAGCSAAWCCLLTDEVLWPLCILQAPVHSGSHLLQASRLSSCVPGEGPPPFNHHAAPLHNP